MARLPKRRSVALGAQSKVPKDFRNATFLIQRSV